MNLVASDRLLVSFSVVSPHGDHGVARCLRSIRALRYPADRIDVWIVGPRSLNGHRPWSDDQLPRVHDLSGASEHPRRAHNLAIAASQGACVALLDSRVTLDPEWLTRLLRVLESDPRAGAVFGPLLFEGTQTIVQAGLQERPDFHWESRGHDADHAYPLTDRQPVSSFSSSAVLCRRACLDDIGVFDEDFQSLYGDVDLSLRCLQRGWQLYVAPTARTFLPNIQVTLERLAHAGSALKRLQASPQAIASLRLVSGQTISTTGPLTATQTEALTRFIFTVDHRRPADTTHLDAALCELEEVMNLLTSLRASPATLRVHGLMQGGQPILLLDALLKRTIRDEAETLHRLDWDRFLLIAKHAPEQLPDAVSRAARARIQDATFLTNVQEALRKLFQREQGARAAAVFHGVSRGLECAFERSVRRHAAYYHRRVTQEVTLFHRRIQDPLVRATSRRTHLYRVFHRWSAVRRRLQQAVLQVVAGVVMRSTASVLERLFMIEHRVRTANARAQTPVARPDPMLADEQTPVSIVIPSWNRKVLLSQCLDALGLLGDVQTGRHEIVVVDDGSTDGTAEMVRTRYPHVTLVRNRHNRGFSISCNRGVQHARHEIIWLLNNDVLVTPDCLPPLVRHLAGPEVFAVMPRLQSWDKTPLPFYTAEFKEGFLKLIGHRDPRRMLEPATPLFAVGAACLMRKRDFLWLGGFDLLYRPCFWEDVDLSYQAWKRGLRVEYEPRSLVFHKLHGTLGRENPTIIFRNYLLFVWKHLNIHWLRAYLRSVEFRQLARIPYLVGYGWALTALPWVLQRRGMEQSAARISDEEVLARLSQWTNDQFVSGCDVLTSKERPEDGGVVVEDATTMSEAVVR